MDGFYGLPISSVVALVVAVALGNENGGAVGDDHLAKAHGDHRKGQHALFEPGLLQAQQQPAPENKKGDGHINGDLAHLGGHKLLGHDHIQQPAQAHEYNVLIGNVPHTAQTAERHYQHQETVHIREAEGQVVGEVEGVPNEIHRIIVKAEQEKQKQYNIHRLLPQRNAPVNKVQGHQQQRQHAAVDIGQHIVAAGANGGLQGGQVGC